MDAQHAAGSPEAGPAPRRRALGRRHRRLLAAVEALAAAGMVPLAVLAWRRASIPVQLPELDNPAIPDFTSRMSGPWAAAAIAAATGAGLLVLDALRHALRAARDRPAEALAAEAGGPAEEGQP